MLTYFETESYSVAHVAIYFIIFMPQPPKCQDDSRLTYAQLILLSSSRCGDFYLLGSRKQEGRTAPTLHPSADPSQSR